MGWSQSDYERSKSLFYLANFFYLPFVLSLKFLGFTTFLKIYLSILLKFLAIKRSILMLWNNLEEQPFYNAMALWSFWRNFWTFLTKYEDKTTIQNLTDRLWLIFKENHNIKRLRLIIDFQLPSLKLSNLRTEQKLSTPLGSGKPKFKRPIGLLCEDLQISIT